MNSPEHAQSDVSFSSRCHNPQLHLEQYNCTGESEAKVIVNAADLAYVAGNRHGFITGPITPEQGDILTKVCHAVASDTSLKTIYEAKRIRHTARYTINFAGKQISVTEPMQELPCSLRTIIDFGREILEPLSITVFEDKPKPK